MAAESRPTPDPRAALTADEREALRKGQHEPLAAELIRRARPELAGWVLEQIWDWNGAFEAYASAGQVLDALRVAIESNSAKVFDPIMARIEREGVPEVVAAAIDLLQARRHPMEAARLLALAQDPLSRARALEQAGDNLGAARALAAAARPHEALALLLESGRDPTNPATLALAAELAWDLGDAEGAARFAQSSLRRGYRSDALLALLARALGALGHHLAARMVLPHEPRADPEAAVPGRYRVTGIRGMGLIGTAYVGFDRVSLREVEVHVLLSEHADTGPLDAAVLTAVERFCATSLAAGRVGHPAIRPILRVDPRAGLLVLPRAEGPPLRTLVRAPGMRDHVWRARGLIAFLLEGLVAAHRRDLVHGMLLPSQIVSDALGRPLLGPFGAHHLAGLAATHTGALDEILMVTAPELRGGGEPTVRSDLYAVGAIYAALLRGEVGPPQANIDELPEPERELISALTAAVPAARGNGEEALAQLRSPVADLRELHGVTAAAPDAGSTTRPERELGGGVITEAAPSWSDHEIDQLCRKATTAMQPILDRHGRRLVLAAWPEGSATMEGERTAALRDRELEALPGDPELRAAVVARLRNRSWVRTPSGTWMLALDDLLTR